MRVNIKGRGIVPRVGKLAPVYNQDLQKNDIEFLLNFNQFKVYETKTGLLITRDTVDEMFAKSQKPVAPKKPTVIEKPAPAPAPVKVEEPVVEVKEEVAPVVEPTVTEEEVAQSFIEDVAAVEEQLPEKEELEFPVENPDTESFEPAKENDEEVADTVEADDEDDVTEEEVDVTVEEEAPQQSYPSKKKNKKKNRS